MATRTGSRRRWPWAARSYVIRPFQPEGLRKIWNFFVGEPDRVLVEEDVGNLHFYPPSRDAIPPAPSAPRGESKEMKMAALSGRFILNIKMPRVDGLTFLRKLLQHKTKRPGDHLFLAHRQGRLLGPGGPRGRGGGGALQT
jgi:DNA-binding response OmpR family regulator